MQSIGVVPIGVRLHVRKTTGGCGFDPRHIAATGIEIMSHLTLKQLSEKFNIPLDRIEQDRDELLIRVDAHGRVDDKEAWAYYHYYIGELGVEVDHEDIAVRWSLSMGRDKAALGLHMTLPSLHRRLQRVAKRDKTIAQLLPGKTSKPKWGIPL